MAGPSREGRFRPARDQRFLRRVLRVTDSSRAALPRRLIWQRRPAMALTLHNGWFACLMCPTRLRDLEAGYLGDWQPPRTDVLEHGRCSGPGDADRPFLYSYRLRSARQAPRPRLPGTPSPRASTRTTTPGSPSGGASPTGQPQCRVHRGTGHGDPAFYGMTPAPVLDLGPHRLRHWMTILP